MRFTEPERKLKAKSNRRTLETVRTCKRILTVTNRVILFKNVGLLKKLRGFGNGIGRFENRPVGRQRRKIKKTAHAAVRNTTKEAAAARDPLTVNFASIHSVRVKGQGLIALLDTRRKVGLLSEWAAQKCSLHFYLLTPSLQLAD